MEEIASSLIPITAILCTFGCPVAIVFLFKWFKLRERELQADTDLRREMNAALESRVQRLESVLLQLDSHQLMQAPPDLRVTERADDPLPLLRKDVRG
jgi:hypothetical protein